MVQNYMEPIIFCFEFFAISSLCLDGSLEGG